MLKTKLRNAIKKLVLACGFLAIGSAIFYNITKIMIIPYEECYQFVEGFYEEPSDSLDAVYIGSSSVFSFWLPPIAWEKYGIKVYSFSTGAQPVAAAPYLIEEVHKTQPNALIMVAINSLYLGPPAGERIHELADYMPFSSTKIRMLWELSDISGYSLPERLEFFFPIIRFHTRWTGLSRNDFRHELNHMKGTWVTDNIFYETQDLTGNFSPTEKR